MNPPTRSIEPLETRIAPATLVNPTTLTFHDVDGDDVTVKFSAPILDSVATANAVFTFDSGNVDANATNDTPQQLQRILLTSLAPGAATGLGITITAKRSVVRGGDGLADVGFLDATGIDLGAVSISGDLGRIVAGLTDSTTIPAVKALTVQSMGELGTSTQAAGGTLISTFAGSLPSLTVKGNLRNADVSTAGPGDFAKMGKVVIGGSIFGGKIFAAGDLASVAVTGDVIAGNATATGRIASNGSIGTVTVGGSVVGALADSGAIAAVGSIKSVSIGRNLLGGTAGNSGLVDSAGDIQSVTIGGTIIGGGALRSGGISATNSLTKVTISGDVIGGDGDSSGFIESSFGTIGSVAIKGSLVGGDGGTSGYITGNLIRSAAVGGNIRAGSGGFSGAIVAGEEITTATVGGSLVGYQGAAGSLGQEGGSIASSLLGTVKVGGSVIGGTGAGSGQIAGRSDGIVSVTVGGSLLGGSGEETGGIFGGFIGNVTIGGDVRGGSGLQSAAISAADEFILSVNIGGSVVTGAGIRSAMITASEDIPSITIKGDLRGAGQKAIISARVLVDNNTATPNLALGKISIGGRVENAEILAGYTGTNAIDGDAQIGSVTVGGDWVASSIAAGVSRGADTFFGTDDDTAITTVNSPSLSSRIGSITIKGQALGSVAGADAFGFVAETIGPVKVGTVAEKLTTGVDAVPLGATADFIAREDVVGANVTLPTITSNTDLIAVGPLTPTGVAIVTYTDVDGDLVTIKASKPVLDVTDFEGLDTGLGVQVQLIDLSDDGPTARGMSLTITAKPQDMNADGVLEGDGFVNIGAINAEGIDLGTVTIGGDLGRIITGDADLPSLGLKALTVQSLGEFGISTQGAGTDLNSGFTSLGSLAVKGSIREAALIINGLGFAASPEQLATATIGTATIGGSIFGGSAADSGRLTAFGKIGSVKVGGSLVGGGAGSGLVNSGGQLGKIEVGGSLIGGAANSGLVFTAGLGSAKIGHNLVDGSGENSGAVFSTTSIGSVTVGGSVIGNLVNHAAGSGQIVSATGISAVAVAGNLIGGASQSSGAINSTGLIGTVTIGGSILGGSAQSSAAISGAGISTVKVTGEVHGGSGLAAGAIFSTAAFGSATIGGSVTGGTLGQSATIQGTTIVGALSVGGNLFGGVGTDSASVGGGTNVSAVTIGGSLFGAGGSSASIFSNGKIGAVKVAGDVRGGAGVGSAAIQSAGTLSSITIGGSLVTGSGDFSAAIRTDANLGSVTIQKNVLGTAADPVRIYGFQSAAPTAKANLAIGKVVIGGTAEFAAIRAGQNRLETLTDADAQIGPVSVGGDWIASSVTAGAAPGTDGFYGTADDVIYSGGSSAISSKIASITVKFRALGTVGGADHFGFVAQEIGLLKIGAVTYPLTAGAGNDDTDANDPRLLVARTGDVRAHELPA